MQKTSISWTDYTSNPIKAINVETGKKGWFCTKISDGCTNCYASSWNVLRGNGLEFNAANLPKIDWVLKETEFVEWEMLKQPSKIFVCDMTDLFHESIPGYFRRQIFHAMRRAPWHTYQLLTKRSLEMKEFCSSYFGWDKPIPRNIWFGVSVENRKQLPRIEALKRILSATHFLSCEPLLESLGRLNLSDIDWIIAGAESGPKRRKYDEAWARELREQCLEQQVAFWYKQGSDRYSGKFDTLDGRKYQEFPKIIPRCPSHKAELEEDLEDSSKLNCPVCGYGFSYKSGVIWF